MGFLSNNESLNHTKKVTKVTRLMSGFWNGAITNWPVKSSVAIETLESNQSHYMIFVFIGELTNWSDKIVFVIYSC
jgi:hypothetical protein